MNSLGDACQVLHQELSAARAQCEAIRYELNYFAAYASNSPLAIVKIRLTLITLQIMTWTASLYAHHGGKGHVFVMVSANVLGVYWVEEEYSAEVKNRFKDRGWLIVSPEEVELEVDQFINQVESGQWADAVHWLNQYGSSLISEATKLG